MAHTKRCVEAYYLQRPRFESITERKLRRRQLTGRAVLGAAPEPKEGWFAPEAGRLDLARYGSLDAVVAFIERRLGG